MTAFRGLAWIGAAFGLASLLAGCGIADNVLAKPGAPPSLQQSHDNDTMRYYGGPKGPRWASLPPS